MKNRMLVIGLVITGLVACGKSEKKDDKPADKPEKQAQAEKVEPAAGEPAAKPDKPAEPTTAEPKVVELPKASDKAEAVKAGGVVDPAAGKAALEAVAAAKVAAEAQAKAAADAAEAAKAKAVEAAEVKPAEGDKAAEVKPAEAEGDKAVEAVEAAVETPEAEKAGIKPAEAGIPMGSGAKVGGALGAEQVVAVQKAGNLPGVPNIPGTLNVVEAPFKGAKDAKVTIIEISDFQ